jgi:hypothetical protein
VSQRACMSLFPAAVRIWLGIAAASTSNPAATSNASWNARSRLILATGSAVVDDDHTSISAYCRQLLQHRQPQPRSSDANHRTSAVAREHRATACSVPGTVLLWRQAVCGRPCRLRAHAVVICMQVWDRDSGEHYTSIEPAGGGINDVAVWPGSGLIMLATEGPKMPVFFAPSLGPAPRWCSFLESVVDDLEAAGGGEAVTAGLYDDYRFVTKEELVRLELDHLIGTSALRAYMHGFFVDARLHRKACARAEPFAYESYRAKRVADRLEEERQSRIALVRCDCDLWPLATDGG